MIIKICVGSSCHLKGSYDVVEAMKSLVSKYHVEDKVELQASFCLGNCAKGVSVLAEDLGDAQPHNNERVTPVEGGFLLHQVTGGNAEDVFVNEILPLLK